MDPEQRTSGRPCGCESGNCLMECKGEAARSRCKSTVRRQEGRDVVVVAYSSSGDRCRATESLSPPLAAAFAEASAAKSLAEGRVKKRRSRRQASLAVHMSEQRFRIARAGG